MVRVGTVVHQQPASSRVVASVRKHRAVAAAGRQLIAMSSVFPTNLQFVETNKELLSTLPPPMAAAAYYRNEDLYMVRSTQHECGGLRSRDIAYTKPGQTTLFCAHVKKWNLPWMMLIMAIHISALPSHPHVLCCRAPLLPHSLMHCRRAAAQLQLRAALNATRCWTSLPTSGQSVRAVCSAGWLGA